VADPVPVVHYPAVKARLMSLWQMIILMNIGSAPERKDDMAATNCWTLEIICSLVRSRGMPNVPPIF
jgi:hypothetical protein